MNCCGTRPKESAEHKNLNEADTDVAKARPVKDEEKKSMTMLDIFLLSPLPPPVTLGLLFGACGVGLFGFKKFCILIIIIFAAFPPLYRLLMQQIGLKVKEYVEKIDRDMIGVDMHLGVVDMSVCYGRFVIHDFQIDNPEGYKSDYLLHAKQLVVDVDVEQLILSKGQRLVIEEFVLEEVDAIVEYPTPVAFVGTSNLQKILDFMSEKKKGKEGDSPDSPRKDNGKDSPRKDNGKTDGKDEKKGAKKGREYRFEKVAVLDLGAKLATAFLGSRIAVADIQYRHFSDDFKATSLTDMIPILMKSVFKSILVNIAGNDFGKKMM